MNHLFCIFTITVVILFVKNILINLCLGYYRGKIEKFIKKIISEETKQDKLEKLNDALWQSELIKKRKDNLELVTLTVSTFEFYIFIILSFLIFSEPQNILLESFYKLSIFTGGWLGIKVILSHGTWLDPVVGKDFYEISILGSLMNIVSALSTGLLLVQLFS